MRISRKKPSNRRVVTKRYKTNQQINAPEVRLIIETGENVGVTPTDKALIMAQEKGLDLVEVSPLANPPVAKIVDYSKLKYQEEKERRKERSKQKKIETKGIRLSLRIGQGDKEVRMKQAIKFLNNEDKVKIEMFLRGRERQHSVLAKKIINDFIESIKKEIEVIVESGIGVQGGKLNVIIAKK